MSKGGGAPRMLCLDDYFMIEVDKIEKDPDSGKRMKKKVSGLSVNVEKVLYIQGSH